MDPTWFNDCWIKVEMVKLSLTWLLDGFHKWADGSWLWELVGITRLCNPNFWVVREKRSEQTKKILDIYITWYNMGYGLKLIRYIIIWGNTVYYIYWYYIIWFNMCITVYAICSWCSCFLMHMGEWNITDFDGWMPPAIDGQGSAEGLQAQEVCKASLEWGNIIHPNGISSSRSLKAMGFSVVFNTSIRFNEFSMFNAKDSKVDWDFWWFFQVILEV